LFCLLAMTS